MVSDIRDFEGGRFDDFDAVEEGFDVEEVCLGDLVSEGGGLDDDLGTQEGIVKMSSKVPFMADPALLLLPPLFIPGLALATIAAFTGSKVPFFLLVSDGPPAVAPVL